MARRISLLVLAAALTANGGCIFKPVVVPPGNNPDGAGSDAAAGYDAGSRSDVAQQGGDTVHVPTNDASANDAAIPGRDVIGNPSDYCQDQLDNGSAMRVPDGAIAYADGALCTGV